MQNCEICGTVSRCSRCGKTMCSDCYLEVDNRKICHLCIEKDGWKSFLQTYVGLTEEQKRLEWERWPEAQRTYLQENFGIPEPQPRSTTPRPSLYNPAPPATPPAHEEIVPPDSQGSSAREWTERWRSFPMGFQGFIGAIVAIVLLGTFSIAILSRGGDSSAAELANDQNQALAVSTLEEENRGLGLVYTRNGVNLRAGPGTDHAVVERTTPEHQPLEYVAKQGEWYQLPATDQMPVRYVHESVVIRVIDYQVDESPRTQRAAEPPRPSASSSEADSSFSSDLSVEALGSAAFAVSKSFVRKALNNPETADFPLSTFESFYLGNGKFRVSSYVDSRNFLGMTDRINYVAILTFIGDTDYLLESHGWKLDRLILDGDVVTNL